MIKVGQIYFQRRIEKKLVITIVDDVDCSWVTSEGKVDTDKQKWIENSCILKAEYPTWQEAVNSKEFKE
mgnify:CR=1 FL=1